MMMLPVAMPQGAYTDNEGRSKKEYLNPAIMD